MHDVQSINRNHRLNQNAASLYVATKQLLRIAQSAIDAELILSFEEYQSYDEAKRLIALIENGEAQVTTPAGNTNEKPV